MDLKEQLIKLGYKRLELRVHLRSLISHLESSKRGMISRRRRRTPTFTSKRALAYTDVSEKGGVRMGQQLQDQIFEMEANGLTPPGLEDAAKDIVSVDERTTKAFKKFINGIESNILDYLADPENKDNVKWDKIGFKHYPVKREEVVEYVEREREPAWEEMQEMVGDGDPADAWDDIMQKDWGTELVPAEKMEESLDPDFEHFVIETLYQEDDAAFDVYHHGAGMGRGNGTFREWVHDVDHFMRGINADGLVQRLKEAMHANIFDEIERLRERLGEVIMESKTMHDPIEMGDPMQYENELESTGPAREKVMRGLRKIETIYMNTKPTVSGIEKSIRELEGIIKELKKAGAAEMDIEIFELAKDQYINGKRELKKHLGR